MKHTRATSHPQHYALLMVGAILIIMCTCQLKPTTDSKDFFLDLPDTSKTHRPDFAFESTKNLVDELNLNRLTNGVDSFELRLWTKVEVTNGGQVLIIKKINGEWTCLEYIYLEAFHGDFQRMSDLEFNTSFSIDTFWVDKKQPQTSWDTFFSSIEQEKIYELPSESDIDGWENYVTDGYSYFVEFATKDKYKFYSYNCPDVYEEDFEECHHMTNILDIFDKEFGLLMGWGGFRCKH